MLTLKIFIFLMPMSISLAKINIKSTTYNGLPENWDKQTVDPFIRIGSKYYFIPMDKRVTWYLAAHICRSNNAQLASIESAAEMKALNDFLNEKDDNRDFYWFWLSGNDFAKEGSFYWLGTGNEMGYTKWAPNEPNNADGTEHCVHLAKGKTGTEFEMNDRECKHEIYFICQANTPKTISFTMF